MNVMYFWFLLINNIGNYFLWSCVNFHSHFIINTNQSELYIHESTSNILMCMYKNIYT